MKAIVILVVPKREFDAQSVAPVRVSCPSDERALALRASNKSYDPDPPFWTWFIENPRLAT
jgi:hypothetical protein